MLLTMNNISIKTITHDYDEWNKFVSRSNNFYTIAQNPSIVKVLKDAFGWNGENVMFYNGDKAIGLLNYMYINKKIVSMPHFSYGGPVNNERYTVDDIWKYYLKLKDVNAYELRMFDKVSKHYNASKVVNYLVLSKNVEEQFMQFKSKLRSQIKKGYKNGLKVRLGNVELLDHFYEVYSRNMHYLGSPVIGKGFFESIFKYYKYGGSSIFCVYHNDMPIGASVVLDYLGFCEVCWASTNKIYNKLAPNMVLYWEMIKYSIENNMKIFSFGRGTKESSSYRFKMQWGTKVKQLYYNYSDDLKCDIKSMKILPMIWARMPYSFVNVIGPFVAKNIY